jgi:hypothetical protein
MSGIIGHLAYAMLGAKAAAHRKLPVAPVVGRHFASYLAGSYLGCDIQTMPEAVCVETGQEVGYGTVPIEKSPITGGAVRPYRFHFRNEEYSPRQIHELFYGRAHVVFGWSRAERELVVPWDHLADYCAAAVEDSFDLFGPGERPLAYACGWMTHIVGDSLIKSVRPDLKLELLDGKYTPRNRPIQDLVTYHEVGRRELRLNWDALLADVADTPVEPIQMHYMRVAAKRGHLGSMFPDGWVPARRDLLAAVCAENRRYLPTWIRFESERLQLRKTAAGWECNEELSRQTGGLTYAEMLRVAEQAKFLTALRQMGDAVADLFEAVVARVPRLRQLPSDDGPTWSELTERWR